MPFDFDATKSSSNKAKHGKDFEEAKVMWTLPGGSTAPHNVNAGEAVFVLTAVYEAKV